MLEINVEESNDSLISLLDKIVQNNEIIIKRYGKRVARLIPEKRKKKMSLPSLADFRASVQVKGKPMSRTLIEMRNEERY